MQRRAPARGPAFPAMAAGFAGIDNELFFNPKTAMLFGDAKQSISKVISEIKQL